MKVISLICCRSSRRNQTAGVHQNAVSYQFCSGGDAFLQRVLRLEKHFHCPSSVNVAHPTTFATTYAGHAFLRQGWGGQKDVGRLSHMPRGEDKYAIQPVSAVGLKCS